MKITVETSYGKFCHDYPDEFPDVDKTLGFWSDMMRAMGFMQESIDEAFMDYVDELREYHDQKRSRCCDCDD
jgi:hypothetical protein